MRKIVIIRSNGSQRYLHPNAFSKEQYEELKNLLPNDRACKVSGCYNNYCRFGGDEAVDTKVTNGLCGYHQAQQEGLLDEDTQEENEPDTDSNTLSESALMFRENWKT